MWQYKIITTKDSYKLIPIALREFGKCLKLDVSKEIMPYNIYTYENVSRGTASVQGASEVLKQEDTQQFLDNLEQWNCNMDNQMFGLIKNSSIHCKMDCKVLTDGYGFSGLDVRAYRIRCRQLYHNSTISQFSHVGKWLL